MAATRRLPLDDGRPVTEVRLCTTLDEIRARLAARAVGDPSIVVYTLPQDIHTATVAREGKNVIDQQQWDVLRSGRLSHPPFR